MSDLIPELRTPTAPEGTGRVHSGMPVSRVDGRAKVTGQAKYAAEHEAPGLRYGVVVSGSIAKGRITAIETDAALAVPGVVEVLTHLNRPRMRSWDLAYKDMTAPGGSPFRPLFSDRIFYSGQPVALVLADSFEAARHAAQLVRVSYAEEAHETDLLATLDQAYEPRPMKAGFTPPSSTGDADQAFEAAEVKIESQFYHGVEHHNPMEMHATTVVYGEDAHLTIYEKTQSSQNNRWYVSQAFGLSKDKVTVRNPYVGGAFGSGLRPQYQLTLAVMAALKLKGSVRVVLSRQQMFSFGHRPETWQKVKLAANGDGKLQAIVHEAIHESSRLEDYVEVVVNWSGQLYACDNIKLGYKIVAHDRHSPIDMRAPGAAHGMHALEVAMDELAYKLRMDPLEFRRINYADRNPLDGKPYSSKELSQCYDKGAARFGWQDRPLAPRSMRDGDELVGWGMATGMWDSLVMLARVSAVLHADGRLVVSSAASDIGTGTYTVMSMIAAEAMGLPLERVTFQLGDSTLPFAPVEGGSSHVTTVGSGVHGACDKLRKRLIKLAKAMPGSTLAKARPQDLEFADGTLRLRKRPETAVPLSEVLAAAGVDRVEEVLHEALDAQAAQVHPRRAFGRVLRGAGQRKARHRARDPGSERRGGRPHHQRQDRRQPGDRRRGVGHQPGAARGKLHRPPLRALHEPQLRRVPRCGERRRPRHRGDLRRRGRPHRQPAARRQGRGRDRPGLGVGGDQQCDLPCDRQAAAQYADYAG